MEKEKDRAAKWRDLARRSVRAKVVEARRTRELEAVVRELNTKVTATEQQRDDVTKNAVKVVDSLEAQMARIAEQCELWRRCDQDAMTTLGGITAEVNGHKLPEPGVWDRRRAVRDAQIRAQLESAIAMEKAAREALIRVLQIFDYKAPGLISMAMDGNYDAIIAGLEKEHDERDHA